MKGLLLKPSKVLGRHAFAVPSKATALPMRRCALLAKRVCRYRVGHFSSGGFPSFPKLVVAVFVQYGSQYILGGGGEVFRHVHGKRSRFPWPCCMSRQRRFSQLFDLKGLERLKQRNMRVISLPCHDRAFPLQVHFSGQVRVYPSLSPLMLSPNSNVANKTKCALATNPRPNCQRFSREHTVVDRTGTYRAPRREPVLD